MKKMKFFVGMTLAVSLLAAGCGSAAPQKPIVYSNLTEESVRFDLDSLLSTAKVSDEQRHVLFNHVDQINKVMQTNEKTDGFTDISEKKYDPYNLMDAWMEAYPDFLGYNCRITSFSLLPEGFLTMDPNIKPTNENMLEFDLQALKQDAAAFPGRENQFQAFYEVVPAEDTKDVQVHAKSVLDAWKDRGITFHENPNISMLNVVLHYADDQILYVGHSAILLPTPDGELWLLEKLSFQEPYQVVKFQNRGQIQKYFMDKYDLDGEDQPNAKPFILENDALMKT